MTLAHRLPPLAWRASPNFSSRHGARVDLVVVHSTEGSYAGSVAWFAQKASGVSAHFVLREDGLAATQMVHVADKAWHACAFNARAVGLECAGFAARGLGAAEWESAASIVAWLCHYLHVPAQWARGGVGPGFCRHYDLGQAGGGHFDPTTDESVWAHFIALVADAARQMDTGLAWPADSSGVAAPDPLTPAGLQAALNTLGFARPPLVVDGRIGPKTMAAVMAFQRAHGLTLDGKAGPDTAAAIAVALKAGAPPCCGLSHPAAAA